MNRLWGSGTSSSTSFPLEHHDFDDDQVPTPPAYCLRVTPQEMIEQSRKITEEQLRELDQFLRAHPEGALRPSLPLGRIPLSSHVTKQTTSG